MTYMIQHSYSVNHTRRTRLIADEQGEILIFDSLADAIDEAKRLAKEANRMESCLYDYLFDVLEAEDDPSIESYLMF